MAHTPGPWWVEVSDDGEQREVYDGFGHTATVYGESATAADNARLIAAAPELHEACKHALHALNTAPRFRCGKFNSYDIASMLEHAIAKAEGRITDNAVS